MPEPSTINTADLERALQLVASQQLAATTALQRWMRISFREASGLLDELEARGVVGPAEGSKARDVRVRYCAQCGRIGPRGFRTLTSDEHGIRITECANRAACRKRWPKPPRNEGA